MKLIEKLGNERKRWGNSILKYESDIRNLLGDVMLSAGVLTYLGNFSGPYRKMLLNS